MGHSRINCQRMFRWMCGAKGRDSEPENRWPVCDLGREVLSVKKMQPCFFYHLFIKGYPVSQVENSRSDTEVPSRKGLPAKEIIIMCFLREAVQKEPKNCSAWPSCDPS